MTPAQALEDAQTLQGVAINNSTYYVMISLTSQSKLGYAKYKIKKAGAAKSIVTSIYRAKMVALAGIAYKMMRRNMTTRGNFEVR